MTGLPRWLRWAPGYVLGLHVATSTFAIWAGYRIGERDRAEEAADRASEAATSRRQFHTAQCHADGGYPLIGERVYCMRRWAHQGEAVVIWERDYR